MLHHQVVFVAVADQELPTVRHSVHCLLGNAYARKIKPGIGAERIVVVAGHIDHLRAALGQLEETPHHLVVRGGPGPALAERPHVDDVADEVDPLALDALQECREFLGACAAEPQMHV